MLLDKMLKTDLEKIKEMPREKIEIPRLMEKFGEPIVVQAIGTDRLNEIQEMNNSGGKAGKNSTKTMDDLAATLEIVADGVVDPNFRDSRLLEKFNTPDPGDIIKAILLPGEIQQISMKILELCGMNEKNKPTQDEIDKEIKN